MSWCITSGATPTLYRPADTSTVAFSPNCWCANHSRFLPTVSPKEKNPYNRSFKKSNREKISNEDTASLFRFRNLYHSKSKNQKSNREKISNEDTASLFRFRNLYHSKLKKKKSNREKKSYNITTLLFTTTTTTATCYLLLIQSMNELKL